MISLDKIYHGIKQWKTKFMQCYSLEINELIQSSQAGVYLFFFSTQLLLKMPMFEFNNCFVFHRTWDVDVQSILEFLKFIYGK